MKIRSICPHCHDIIPAGKRCECRPRRKPDERKRAEQQPWRESYSDAEYDRNRQRVIASQHGRCGKCGQVVATLNDLGTWTTFGGQTHHKVPLSQGGTHTVGNLVLLCHRHHAIADRDRRRGV